MLDYKPTLKLEAITTEPKPWNVGLANYLGFEINKHAP